MGSPISENDPLVRIIVMEEKLHSVVLQLADNQRSNTEGQNAANERIVFLTDALTKLTITSERQITAQTHATEETKELKKCSMNL